MAAQARLGFIEGDVVALLEQPGRGHSGNSGADHGDFHAASLAASGHGLSISPN
jgi:hypothetical protein